MAHLQRLIASDPSARKWHIMLDNLNIHQSEALVRQAYKNRCFIPTAAFLIGALIPTGETHRGITDLLYLQSMLQRFMYGLGTS